MEKTLGYALNEALETGRRSAMPEFLEAELREKIAQEIENMEPAAADFIDNLKGKYWVARCASIARGQK